MFCPSCGKDNQDTARFCRSCGRSLVGLAVQQSDTISPLERIEYRLDEIIAHHAGRYFKQTSAAPPPAGLKESWKLLGKGYLAVLADVFYIWLMVQFILEFRLVLLLIKSPMQWWRERKTRKQAVREQAPLSPQLPQRIPGYLSDVSVTEQATERLQGESRPGSKPGF